MADEKGRTTDKYDYDAFGNLISSTGRTENGFLFAGEQFDSVTGLYYLRARYMNPSVGTFISMDAYSGSIDDPTSLHKYLYAHANPVSNSEPKETNPNYLKHGSDLFIFYPGKPVFGIILNRD